MLDIAIGKDLKRDIESNQNQLKTAIFKHQKFVATLKHDPDNVDIQKELVKAEEEIVFIGLEQKALLERLREEYKAHQKSFKNNVVKNGIEERRCNLNNALNRARKQNITTTINRSASGTSFSDDSLDNFPLSLSPEHPKPTIPHEISQSEFLTYFSLASHDVYKEMQNKRAERKRRSTANPQFLYGNRGWDCTSNNKRKRNAYLMSAVSPPNTRQSAKKRNGKTSPPQTVKNSVKEEATPVNGKVEVKPIFSNFPTIPNLPSGLIIERVSPGCSSPDSKSCIKCKQPGFLSVCEVCSNGFHIGCHNRPLTQTPRQCPKCLPKEVRTVGSLTVPSGMTVSYVSPTELSEKLKEKEDLKERKDALHAELSELQDKHSQLTISLKSQKSQQEQLLMTQQSTEDKIKQIMDFINVIKNPTG